jgi:hypothetical protein
MVQQLKHYQANASRFTFFRERMKQTASSPYRVCVNPNGGASKRRFCIRVGVYAITATFVNVTELFNGLIYSHTVRQHVVVDEEFNTMTARAL